jgi:hypothetical protein
MSWLNVVIDFIVKLNTLGILFAVSKEACSLGQQQGDHKPRDLPIFGIAKPEDPNGVMRLKH